jgi:hypothetical protein
VTAETAEHHRLEEARTGAASWKAWGPYLGERRWGTVREDYSEDGDAWNYGTHDQARSRAYRWGEDGIATFQTDPHRHDLLLFHEYFQGDNGAGIRASHQTGWTGTVAVLISLAAGLHARTSPTAVGGVESQ